MSRRRSGVFDFSFDWGLGSFTDIFSGEPRRRGRRRGKRDPYAWFTDFLWGAPKRKRRRRRRRRADSSLAIVFGTEGAEARRRRHMREAQERWSQMTDRERAEARLHDRLDAMGDRLGRDVWAARQREIAALMQVAEDYGWADELPDDPDANDEATREAIGELLRNNAEFIEDAIEAEMEEPSEGLRLQRARRSGLRFLDRLRRRSAP